MESILIDYFDGNEWDQVDEKFLHNVSNIREIKEVYKEGDNIKVVYNDNKEVYYQSIHGSWGFPHTIK